MIAAVGSTPYNIVLVVHILTALVAFAPAFVHPLVAAQTRTMDPGQRRAVFGYMAANGRRIYAPALIVTGLLGFALSGMSDGDHELSELWLILAVVIWIAMNGILHAVLLPAERAVAAGDDSAESRLGAGGAVIGLLLVVTLVLMVFQPN